MRVSVFIPILLVLFSCKDYLDLVPKNEQVVANVDDVRTELLTFWAAHVQANAGSDLSMRPSYGQSSLSLLMFNDVNSQLAMYEDNLDMVHFNDRISNNDCMNCYWQSTDWKSRTLASSLWQNGYSTIGFMNAILDDLAKVPHTQEEAETIGGEAKVIRAWSILKLLQFFAPYDNDRLGIPLNLDSENVTPGDRLPQSRVYDVIERELLEVLRYTTPGKEWNFFYTPAFIRSALAEMYLFRAGSAAARETDWESVERFSASEITNYVPEDSPEMLRSLFGAEQVAYERGGDLYAVKLSTRRFFTLGDSYYGIWGVGNANQQPTEELWTLYEPGDIRLNAWFSAGIYEGDRAYIGKPVVYTHGRVNDITVFYRKADLYLMNVEAKCHLGKEGEAAEMLKAFREIRIPGRVPSVDGDVLEELRKERRRELCFEYGSRWLDMKRWGVRCVRPAYDQETGEVKLYTLEGDDYRYALPIPESIELDYNNIAQNPGWSNYD